MGVATAIIGEGPGSPRPLPHHRTCGPASGGSPSIPERGEGLNLVPLDRDSALCGSPRASPYSPPQRPRLRGWLPSSPRSQVRQESLARAFGPSRLFFFPAGTMASADFSLVSRGVSASAVHSHPTNVAVGHLSDPKETSPDKNDHFPPTADASTLRPLGGDGLRRVWPAHPDRLASYAVRVPRCRDLPRASFRSRLATTPLP